MELKNEHLFLIGKRKVLRYKVTIRDRYRVVEISEELNIRVHVCIRREVLEDSGWILGKRWEVKIYEKRYISRIY